MLIKPKAVRCLDELMMKLEKAMRDIQRHHEFLLEIQGDINAMYPVVLHGPLPIAGERNGIILVFPDSDIKDP